MQKRWNTNAKEMQSYEMHNKCKIHAKAKKCKRNAKGMQKLRNAKEIQKKCKS